MPASQPPACLPLIHQVAEALLPGQTTSFDVSGSIPVCRFLGTCLKAKPSPLLCLVELSLTLSPGVERNRTQITLHLSHQTQSYRVSRGEKLALGNMMQLISLRTYYVPSTLCTVGQT